MEDASSAGGPGGAEDLQKNLQDLTLASSDGQPGQDATDATDATDALQSDGSDSRSFGYGARLSDRPSAAMPVARLDANYNMGHKRRGHAIIFVYENFGPSGPSRRECAERDMELCKSAFKSLQFDVTVCWDLKKRDLIKKLNEVSKANHSDHDCLAVVFMSHGGKDDGEEFVWTFDNKLPTADIWTKFTADSCPTLAGKPKLFFIQACRGEDVDKGVKLNRPKPRGMTVQTDSVAEEKDYTIPLHADILIMWASYPGMFAFKSGNHGINGSVFLHFLCKVLREDGRKDDLTSMLVRVTREVAVHYESYVPGHHLLHQNKQIPYTVSTLMRKLYFQ